MPDANTTVSLNDVTSLATQDVGRGLTPGAPCAWRLTFVSAGIERQLFRSPRVYQDVELIFDGMFALSLLLALAWGLSVRRSIAADRAKAEEAARQAEHEAEGASRQAEREARLNRPGEPLRCLGCENTFTGPLGPDGCPHCRLASLVVPEAECSEKGY